METLTSAPLTSWPEERRAALARASERAGWSRAHTGRVRRALELWYGFTDAPPTAERLRICRAALEIALTPASARTYAQSAVQGLTLLLPGLRWPAVLSDLRGRDCVRSSDRPRREAELTVDWPSEWRERWRAARFSGGGGKANRRSRLKRGHRASRWSEAYARRIARGLDRFLRWTQTHQPSGDPVEAYIATLDDLAPTSAATFVEDLAEGLPIVEPAGDLGDLKDLARAMKREARGRSKVARIVEVRHLLDLGRTLMREAEAKPLGAHSAIRYRDGLMIALLALRPVRLANFSMLRQGESLYRAGDTLLLSCPKTKNGDGWTAAVPATLEAAMERWLEHCRPLLRNRATEDDGAVWLGLDGRALTPKSISRRLGDITQKRLGRRVNPHLFRSVLATDLGDAGEETVGVAAAMLGHRDPRTMERYYRQGGTRRAARALDDLLGVYRMPVRPPNGPHGWHT